MILVQSMAGRGRGRGALRLTVRQPGPPPPADDKADTDKKDASHHLEQIISQLRRLSVDVSENQLKGLHRTVSEYAVSTERLESVVKFLYTRCQQDHKTARVMATVADGLAAVEVDGRKFRSVMFNLVQADFKNKEDLFANSPNKFVAIVSFLCQLFSIMKISGKPLVALVIPIYEFLKMLVSDKSSEKMVECFAIQIATVGMLIEETNSEKMTELMLNVRSKIISHKSSEKSRCLLLEVLDQQANKWQQLSSDLIGFYGQTLAEENDTTETWD